MKVGLIAVCHGSYKESLKFLESLDLSLVSSKVELDIFFVENSSQFSEKMVDQIRRAGLNYSLKYIESENLGYFPSESQPSRAKEYLLASMISLSLATLILLSLNLFFRFFRTSPSAKQLESMLLQSCQLKTMLIETLKSQ